MGASHKEVYAYFVGTGGLPRFGHARGMTPHRGVIQGPRALRYLDCPLARNLIHCKITPTDSVGVILQCNSAPSIFLFELFYCLQI